MRDVDRGMQEEVVDIFPGLEVVAGICWAKEGGKSHEKQRH